MENGSDTQEFSLGKRVKSFAHAGRGLKLFLKTTHNAWIHCVVFVLALLLGFYFQISQAEWLALILAGGLVFTAESFNTAIEIDMDLTSPEYHPAARDTKDVAAGAVLISAIIAVVIGCIIFIPHILHPTIASAHEVYVLNPGEVETAMHTASPNPFTAISTNELQFIGWGIVIALAILAVLAISVSPFFEKRFDRYLMPLKKYAPLVGRITLGLSLLASGYFHGLFGPELLLSSLSIPLMILGLWILSGFYTQIPAALALCIFIYAIFQYKLYMLTYANYLGEILLVLLVYGYKQWERYSFLILRIFYGAAVIYASFYAKFLHSNLAMDTVANYHLTNYFPFSPLFLVLGAFLVEFVIGLCFMIGFEIRFASIIFTIFLILSISFFGEAVWPHLILFGVNITLFFHGYDKYTLTNFLFQKKRKGEPVL